MFSQLRINLLLVLLLCLSFNGFGQRDTLRYVKSPYRSEYTPHFKLTQFKRGFSEDSLKIALDSLQSKPKNFWTRTDSLHFAKISLETGNRSLSEYYFDQLKLNVKTEENYWYDHLIIHYLNGEYKKGVNEITQESPMILQYSRIYFFKKIFEAKANQQADEKWYKTHRVFNWDVDTSLHALKKDSPEFQEKVISPLRNLEFVLKKIVAHVHEDDIILASACREMGQIIEGHLNLTHAYIAFSLGRHYNKRDKALLEDLSAVKNRITEKKYKIPNFRKYFPRIEKWRFEYEVLKEKVIYAKSDTNTYVEREAMKEAEEPLITFPHQYIVIGGLAVMILLLALILKPQKR